MLDAVFLRILDMSKTGSLVILAVLLARLLLKKAPKVFSYALWAAVLFRLLCPVSFEAQVSLLPKQTSVTQSYELAEEPISAIGAGIAAYQAVGDALNGGLGVQHVPTTQRDPMGNVEYVTTDWWNVVLLSGQYLWLAGVAAMLLYSSISYGKLRKKLRVAVPLENGIFLADDIQSPFVVGFLRPRIYLPGGLGERERQYILLHERQHIRRFDPLIKILAFAALCLHWFNPLVWLAFTLACKDMEMSCDEAVLKKLGGEIRAEYAASLLTLATGRRIIAGTPLAFGEGDPKGRIKNLAKWKKPAMWVIVIAAVACAVLGICLLADPVSGEDELLPGGNYAANELLYDVTEGERDIFDRILVTADYRLYCHETGADYWLSGRDMEAYPLTEKELKQYTAAEVGWKGNYRIGKISDAYIVRMENDYFYLVIRTKGGDTLLGLGWEDVSERNDPYSDDTSLRWMYKLQPQELEEDEIENFVVLSLYASLGKTEPIEIAAFEKTPGYMVAGFLADPNSNVACGYNDMGFAVFRKSGLGYCLLDCYVYEDAACADNGIWYCSDPAVLDSEGKITDKTAYDVILSVNPELSKIHREYYRDDTLTHTATVQLYGEPAMCLFSWNESPQANRISQQYLDAQGRNIEDHGMIQGQTRLAEGTYIPVECLYLNPLSSYYPHQLSEDYQYTVTEDSWIIRGILQENGVNVLSVDWRWQTLEEAEAALAFLKETPLGDELPLYDRLVTEDSFYQPLDATRCLLKNEDGLYLIQHTDQLWYIFVLKPVSEANAAPQPKKLTLADVLALSQKGEALVWEDIAGFENEDIGSGLYICQYRIDPAWYLQVSDGKQTGSPMRVELVSTLTGASVDIRTENVAAFIAARDANSLEVMTENAIPDGYDPNVPDGLIHVKSHIVLAEENAISTPLWGKTERVTEKTLYLLTMHKSYNMSSGIPVEAGGSCSAAAVTFSVDAAGQYWLKEYWEPCDGEDYADAIRQRFPGDVAEIAMDLKSCEPQLNEACYRKACTYLVPTDSNKARIKELFLEISAYPAQYSMPGPYIEAHPEQWQELLFYRESTLLYCFAEFTPSGQKGNMEMLMALACEEILTQMGETDFPAVEGHGNGSQWFNHFKEYAQLLEMEKSSEEIKRRYPGAWLYLQLYPPIIGCN